MEKKTNKNNLVYIHFISSKQPYAVLFVSVAESGCLINKHDNKLKCHSNAFNLDCTMPIVCISLKNYSVTSDH